MFFEFEDGLTVVVHQWLSWLYILGSIAHIAINFRAFKNRIKSPWGKVSVVVFGVILIASSFSGGMITGPQLKRPIEEALVFAPITALAGVSQTSADDLLRRLAEHGIVAHGNQSIYDLSLSSDIDENYLLSIVFLPN